MEHKKVMRVSTVAMSLDLLLKGQLKYLNQFYEVVAVSGDDQHLVTVRKREQVKTVPVLFSRPISIFQDIKSLIKLYQVIRKEKPDIIHSITPKAGLLSMVAGRLAGVPIRIHTFTGLLFPYRKGMLQKILIAMDKVLCACATNIYPEGVGVKNDLIKFNITKKNLSIIGNGNVNGVDLEYYKPCRIDEQLQANLGVSNNDFVFIFIGRIVGDKGIRELITAFSNISIEHKNIKLLLVGGYEQELDPLEESTLMQIKSNDKIIETGFQSDIRPYLNLSNALVFPSYREGFPNVVLQAGAMELPAVVTDISGSNEIISDQFNGYIVPKQDSASLQQRMMDLYLNKEQCALMGKNARLNVSQKYSQDFVWESIRLEYEKLLKNV